METLNRLVAALGGLVVVFAGLISRGADLGGRVEFLDRLGVRIIVQPKSPTAQFIALLHEVPIAVYATVALVLFALAFAWPLIRPLFRPADTPRLVPIVFNLAH